MAKYRLTNNVKKTVLGELRQIEALEDIERFGISTGDLGGWIEDEKNLDQSGDAWVYGNALVSGDALVYGNARVYGDARVSGNAWVFGNARVYGDAQVSGDAWVYGDALVYGNALVSGDALVYGNARVSGDAWDKSPLFIQGTRWSMFAPTKDTVQIGCQRHTYAEWRKSWKRIAKEFESEDLVEEYSLYFNVFSKRYSDGEPIDLTVYEE